MLFLENYFYKPKTGEELEKGLVADAVLSTVGIYPVSGSAHACILSVLVKDE